MSVISIYVCDTPNSKNNDIYFVKKFLISEMNSHDEPLLIEENVTLVNIESTNCFVELAKMSLKL